MIDKENVEWVLYQSSEVIRDLQNEGIEGMMALCQRGHRFYQEFFSKNGIDFESIRTVEDLESVPLTSKVDYMEHPEDFILKIQDAPAFERILYNLLYTTGTSTGRPTPFYNTAHDYYATLMAAKRLASIMGIMSNDVIANTYPLTNVPHLTFFGAFCCATVSGASLVSTLTGTPHPDFPVTNSSHRAAQMIQECKATIIWGIPSFIRRLLMMAEEMGLRYPYLRLAAVAGEPCSQGLREDIIQRMKALGANNPFVNNRYGFTEISTVFTECDPRGENGFHNPAPDMFFLETVDEQTGKRVPKGDPGYLAVTHLNRRGTILIRYLTGDIAVISHEACPACGRTTSRIVSQPYRKSELLKFKGTLINPKPLVSALSEIPEVEEFQVIFTRLNPSDPLSQDHLQVKLSTRSDREKVKEKVINLAVQVVEMRPEVIFVDQNEIYDIDKSFKSKRIIDLRK